MISSVIQENITFALNKIQSKSGTTVLRTEMRRWTVGVKITKLQNNTYNESKDLWSQDEFLVSELFHYICVHLVSPKS